MMYERKCRTEEIRKLFSISTQLSVRFLFKKQKKKGKRKEENDRRPNKGRLITQLPRAKCGVLSLAGFSWRKVRLEFQVHRRGAQRVTEHLADNKMSVPFARATYDVEGAVADRRQRRRAITYAQRLIIT